MATIRIKTRDGVEERQAEAGARLDDLILSAGIVLDRPCGGRGTCGKCRVQASGGLTPPTAAEKKLLADGLRAGWRLACQARLAGDAQVEVGAEVIFFDKTFFTAGVEREPGPLGLAVDLGTTTVAALAAGFESGRVYSGNAVLNRQAAHGAEVMSRLLYAERAPDELRRLAWESVREAASGLPLGAAERSRVTRAVVVGNSAMHHLALGRPVATLLRSPFMPGDTGLAEAPLAELTGLFPALERLVFAPLIGGFVGADALACLLYFGLSGEGEPALALDLGTNGEIMLSAGGRVWVASAAAGPAFEGVNISCGMRAVPGAVTRVAWAGESRPGGRSHKWELTTVGGAEPAGLAGSGLLSAARALREIGGIDASGRIDEGAPGFERAAGGKQVRLHPRVVLTQNDVRELQKAKGAVRAGVESLIERAGIGPDALARVILTGSFGGRLDPADMLALGVLPELPPARLYSIPNGAGLGAALMLRDEELRRAEELAARAEHVELNLAPGFMDTYVARMALGNDLR